ncbi:lactase/phlorizin hydrolase-like isoform X3 [Diabrotica virgifera virgifera]|uniref:Myrosinase 1-like n=1 Tax=Diabrotica virgifera virgifera TaxID=50390 RepID=A0ABM5KWS7_DIAVI|nr:lactase/phlorizin hydrolase-like isoform X3 [Diabrotica virgifera virgifera]
MTSPVLIFILVHLSTNVATSINYNRFPSDFLWGASTSAFQFEGAWNEDGKAPSVWDYFLHNQPYFVPDGSNADVSANAYHMVETDVELAKSLNLKVFRTSVAWTRILPQGTVSLTIAGDWHIPKTSSIEDKEAAERQLQFKVGWFVHPLYHGNYPSAMIETIKNISINEEGRNSSRLPEFTEEEIEYIKGTNDVFYLNTYHVYHVSNVIKKLSPSFDNDIRGTIEEIPDGAAWGIRSFISWIRKNCNNVPIFITENGKGSTDYVGLQDDYRIDFMQKMFSSIRDSMEIDNATILGYTFWSLYDGFEVQYGYRKKMGLAYIDFNSNNKTRIPRKSAYYYSNVSRTGCISNSRCVYVSSCDGYTFPMSSIMTAITVHLLAILTLCRS